jgi:hypothetical protein
MRHAIPRFTKIGVIGVLALAGTATRPVAANEVYDWNIKAVEANAVGGQNNIVAARTKAIMHLAIHDALNAIERRYEPYLYVTAAEPTAAPGAAIAAAAHDVLVGITPDWGKPEQQKKALQMIEGLYVDAMAKIPDGAPKRQGTAAGQAAAAAILTMRKLDGWNTKLDYIVETAPGKWQPHPNPVPANPPIADPALAAGNAAAVMPQWARVTPFTMVSPAQFRLPGPPALASADYARDFDEVKQLGARDSALRTAEQTEIAKFWYEGTSQGWSRIARVVAAERGLDRWEAARLLALVNAVVSDGYVAGADTRYLHNFWRPITAIRAADHDANDATAADPKWESFLNTPALPDYPSTHSVGGAAAAVVLARFFGTDQVAFEMTSGPPFAGITRRFTSFSQAAQENADSRVYAGIHFRSACRDGMKLGEQIGRRAFVHVLQQYRS